MQITNIHEAEAHISRFIERVIAGEEIIIGKGRQPVAMVGACFARNNWAISEANGQVEYDLHFPIQHIGNIKAFG